MGSMMGEEAVMAIAAATAAGTVTVATADFGPDRRMLEDED